jgi:hypothetical protein
MYVGREEGGIRLREGREEGGRRGRWVMMSCMGISLYFREGG